MVFRPAGKPKRQTFTHTCPFPCSLSLAPPVFFCVTVSHTVMTQPRFISNAATLSFRVLPCMPCTNARRCIVDAQEHKYYLLNGIFFLSFSSSFEAIFSARRRREYKEACWGLLVVVGKFHFLLRPCHAMRVICVLHGPFSYGSGSFSFLGTPPLLRLQKPFLRSV